MNPKENGATPRPLPTLALSDAMAMMDEPPTEMDKILELILDPRHLGNFTELSKAEIHAFSVLGSMAKRHKLTALTDFLVENLTLRVSHKRKGRAELIKMVGRHLAMESENQENEIAKNRFFGRGRR